MTIALFILLPLSFQIPISRGAARNHDTGVSPPTQSYLGVILQLIYNLHPLVSGEQSIGIILLGHILWSSIQVVEVPAREIGIGGRSPYFPLSYYLNFQALESRLNTETESIIHEFSEGYSSS